MNIRYKYGGKTGGGGESDDDNSITDGKFGGGGRMYQNGGKVITGQDTSTVRTEQAPDGSTREYVWYDEQVNESVMGDAPDGDWARSGAIKVYGNWNEYAGGQTEDGSMYLRDETFPIMENEDGSFSLDERTYEDSMGGQGASRMDDMMERMMDAERQRNVGARSMSMMTPPMGGQGASQVEDLLQRLSDVPSSPMQFAEGGTMPEKLLQYFKAKSR